MKPSHTLSKKLFGGLFAALLVMCSISAAQAQVFYANSLTYAIDEYDTSGNSIPFISVPTSPQAIAISGNNLFVARWAQFAGDNSIMSEYSTTSGSLENNWTLPSTDTETGIAVSGDGSAFFVSYNSGPIGEYSTSTGQPINTTIMAAISNAVSLPNGLAVSGNELYVTAAGGNIDAFNLTTGSGGNIVSGLGTAFGLAISGNNLFVANYNFGSNIGEYTTSGSLVKTSLVSSDSPMSLAISGNNLYVANTYGGTIDEYTLSSDLSTVDSSIAPLVSGLNTDYLADTIAVESVPEPSTWAMLLGGLGLLAFWHRRKLIA